MRRRIEIFSDETMDHFEAVLATASDADEGMAAFRTLGLIADEAAGHPGGGAVIFSGEQFSALIWMLDTVKRQTAAAREAAEALQSVVDSRDEALASLKQGLLAGAAPPAGIEIFSAETLDHIEANLAAACDAEEATTAAVAFIKAGIAGATAGGVILSVGDLQAMAWSLDLVKGRAVAARAAAEALHSSIQE